IGRLIAVDARWVFKEVSGIGRYTLELLKELGRQESDFKFLVIVRDGERRDAVAEGAELKGKGRFEFAFVDHGPFSPKGQMEAARLLKEKGAAVYHSTNFMVPLPAFPAGKPHATKCVCNIHDLIPLVHPEYTPKALKTRFGWVYRGLMRAIAERVDAVVTGSKSAKRDIVERLRLPEGKVAVAYDGVDERYSPGGPEAVGEGPKRVLYVGRSDPYKNVAGLIESFARLVKGEDGEALDAVLEIAGPPEARYPEAGRVRWRGYVSDEELLAAYRGADALALFSRYEGFGLPVAEAMACGTPVVCSNAASLPEVAGDAALLVDPEDTKGAADALERVLTDAGLWRRMRAAGLEQSKRFRWKTAATAVLQLYGAMLCEPG
ncbi:MAG: glycosyltransferase family 4 protein, partial [Kiritimatiellae bacterium]|nr:glycosyltransferase family 4 protein [Kiritimatiellia bacterium]